MEPRSKTLIERLGFSDSDRRNFRHDQIQIWAYQNFHSIVKAVFPLLPIKPELSTDLKLEYPVSDRNFIVGFVDVYSEKLSIAIEVKTEIPIVGDLIRQVQFYRKYISGSWIVVSPDDRNANILKSQGICFYKYAQQCKSQLVLFS